MHTYKAPDGSLHALSDEDISNGGEQYLPVGCIEITEAEADVIRASNVPAPSIPIKVTMRQARLALLQAGKLELVNTAIAAMQGIEGQAAKIEWDYSNEVLRTQPLTISLAQAIGMTEAEMDQLFITAATL